MTKNLLALLIGSVILTGCISNGSSTPHTFNTAHDKDHSHHAPSQHALPVEPPKHTTQTPHNNPKTNDLIHQIQQPNHQATPVAPTAPIARTEQPIPQPAPIAAPQASFVLPTAADAVFDVVNTPIISNTNAQISQYVNHGDNDVVEIESEESDVITDTIIEEVLYTDLDYQYVEQEILPEETLHAEYIHRIGEFAQDNKQHSEYTELEYDNESVHVNFTPIEEQEEEEYGEEVVSEYAYDDYDRQFIEINLDKNGEQETDGEVLESYHLDNWQSDSKK